MGKLGEKKMKIEDFKTGVASGPNLKPINLDQLKRLAHKVVGKPKQ